MSTQEKIAFHFDPLCPWAWLTSRWARRMEELGEIQVEWRLFSLAMVHLDEGAPVPEDPAGPSGPGLALLARARRLEGNDGVDRLYTALGDLVHRQGRRLSEDGLLDEAWKKAGLGQAGPGGDADDRQLWQDVLADHRRAVEACQAFGVPTLILDGGEGPGIFGPVITEIPTDQEGRELLQDVLRITRRPYFFELKRDREGHSAQTQG